MTKQTRHTVSTITYHLGWCPTYRRPVLAGDVGLRLSALLPDDVQQRGGDVHDLVGMPDHGHVVASFPPTLAMNQIMHRLNRQSSSHLRKAFPHVNRRLPSLWTRRYAVGTAGHVRAATIKRYIDNQKGQ
ncbi:IS200/IS605 family transposase [Chloroflexus sp.]|uniref:IS200/IS605 family transposase n=1 Tax=Chloroflexus sp. TaxID=1904827 RepID=UPI003A0FF0DB